MEREQPRRTDESRPDEADSQTVDLYRIRTQLLVRDTLNPPAEPRPPVHIHTVTRSIADGVVKTSAGLAPAGSLLAAKLTRTVPIAASAATAATMQLQRSATALARTLLIAVRRFAKRAHVPASPALSSATPVLEPAASDELSVRNSREIHLARLRLAARESARGFNHPDVASELHLLGALEHEAGRFNEALALYSTALGIRERTLGRHNPEVAATLADLNAARRDEAENETEAQQLAET